MKRITIDRIPHLTYHGLRIFETYWHTFFARLSARWWRISLGDGCRFTGRPHFRRYPGSQITIGRNCRFNSSATSNWIGVNRPCLISTLKEGAELSIGEGCGFSGTVIACAKRIQIGNNVRCGANTLINDTDWHGDDLRTGPDKMVIIQDNVWIGANVSVLKGVTIGEGSLVATGSIVTQPIPKHSVAGGVPTKLIRTLEMD
jgi:acetyltransferase-like isoleucine patch superfamily enzyme